MRVVVINDLSDLASDTAAIGPKFAAKAPGVVKRNVTQGERAAKKFARAASGPHGKAYYKRISSEMTGDLEGEFGPHDGGTPVGAGFRHDGPNTDLLKAADVQGPKFAKDVGDLVDGLFW